MIEAKLKAWLGIVSTVQIQQERPKVKLKSKCLQIG